MWEYVLKNSELDILILQDGVGVDPSTFEWKKRKDETLELIGKISEYFTAVKNAADAAGKPLWGNAELFTNKGTRNSPKLESSTFDQIQLQLQTEAEYVEKFVCFDFHYMDFNKRYTFFKPLGGSETEDKRMRKELYDSYKAYWEKWRRNHLVK